MASDCGKFTCTLQAAKSPTSKAWTQPASFSYTFDNTEGADDSFAVDVAARIEKKFGETDFGGFFETEWHRNNTSSDQQNQLALGFGLSHEYRNRTLDEDSLHYQRFFSVYTDATIQFSRKATFADLKSVLCENDSTDPQCQTQFDESIRFLLDFSPYLTQAEGPNGQQPSFFNKWETTFSQRGSASQPNGPSWVHSFSPVASLFHDDIINDVIDPKTGLEVDGSVTGLKVVLGAAISPRWSNYRLVFRGSAQGIWTLDRSMARQDTFDNNTSLLTLSADYELTSRSFDGEKNFVPSIGITYTKGSDPLAGIAKADKIVVGLKVAFK